ncbi:hypothetical protein SteCoe_31856 [Stentor coeruleus]|uniref:DUF924 domain-containing protein n=1 Tax=Stentor coeruleus TaxID=5963 RepID=A0A1R2B0J2_9CILI|nr:hypothetical protein SteCoe_31856 [Stentor coeruleus]
MSVAENILNFWFEGFDNPEKINAKEVNRWFMSTEEYNKRIRDLFFEDLLKAERGEYDNWINSPRENLALIILLDQFSRNLYKDTPGQVKNDPKAVDVAKYAIDNGFDMQLWPIHRLFIYLPFEHAEDLRLQQFCLDKFDQNIASTQGEIKEAMEGFKYFAHLHYVVIEKYGRFPGRNKMLGRSNTAEEDEYLKTDPYGF